MAMIDTSVYRPRRGGLEAISQISRNVGGAIGNYQQSKMADLAMRQREFEFQQAQERAKREEEERLRLEEEAKRKQARDEDFLAEYQTAQMEEGENVSPETMQRLYADYDPMGYAKQQVKGALSRDPYAGRRLKVMEDKERRLTKKDETRRSQFEQKQRLDYKKFLLAGQKNEEQIRQFEERQAMQREQMDMELSKPERERDFAQKTYRMQLPDYLQGSVKPSKMFTQSEVDDLKKANNHYGDIYKKINDLVTLVPTPSSYIAAKGTGETAGRVQSQVSQIITDYNRNIALLGALAGGDLTLLENAIPSPAQWKTMTYSTWKKTMGDLKKNIKEKYQGLMRNADVNVSGNLLDKIAKQARITTEMDANTLTPEEEGAL